MASIRKRGKSCQITAGNGRDIHDKQILETATWTPDPNKTEKQNQKALERFAMDFEDRVKSKKFLKDEKMTYQEYSALWLSEYAEKQMERTSIKRCESSLNGIILPAIGHLKLSEIQPLHLTRLYNELSEKGYIPNGKQKPYSTRTIKRIHQIISSSLNTAVYWQLIESNPLAIFGGFRRGELSALTLEDIDFQKHTVTINKASARTKDGIITKAPKNIDFTCFL